jgi:hypothetical protein
MLQKPVTLILLASLFASVARAFEAAFHAKIFTFGGTATLQIFDQQGFSPSGKLLEAGKLACSGVDCSASLYALRTEKIPDFSNCHANTSSSPRLDGFIFRISSESIG